MTFQVDEIRRAYVKLRTYIYYDTTDLLLRRQLVEFETGFRNDQDRIMGNPDSPYRTSRSIFDLASVELDEKLTTITDRLNRYHEEPTFFDHFINNVDVNFFPKKLKELERDSNYVTNERLQEEYVVERSIPFIHAAIELHLISVLWILKHGYQMDATLGNVCHGNRLVLNQDSKGVVQGSSLFKPYVKQYQKWRDDSVKVAERLIGEGKNVAFLNLDVKDYFTSVRLDPEKLYAGRKNKSEALHSHYNLQEIFLRIHQVYSQQITGYRGQHPDKADPDRVESSVCLPIGLLSSYVLANDYLKEFDRLIQSEVRPDYYGRYVDDMLIVIGEPAVGSEDDEMAEAEERRFTEGSKLEAFVKRHLSGVLTYVNRDKPEKDRIDFTHIQGLHSQSDKSLLYYFDHRESHVVLDRLKQELEDRSSEFRDFPEEGDNERNFIENAYHLQYDGTEGKIRTLKDYKENRYGLTIYLSNKIFSGLLKSDKLSDKEADEVVRFFRGLNCLQFYRLWERILTLLLVNEKPEHYVRFYLHCLAEVRKLEVSPNVGQKGLRRLRRALAEYLDCAHEISLALNLDFVDGSAKASRHLNFNLNALRAELDYELQGFEPTVPDSYWLRRFRLTNMVRHNHVVQPLLTYTVGSKHSTIRDLTRLPLDVSSYVLDDRLMQNSPRRVKFWECSLAVCLHELSAGVKVAHASLDRVLDRYKQANQDHIPAYDLDGIREQIYYESDVVNERCRETHIHDPYTDQKKSYSVAFANTEVVEERILAGLRGSPDFSARRYARLAAIINMARAARPERQEGVQRCDVLLFPEFFMPLGLLSSLVRNAARNSYMTITGLEHVTVNGVAHNFIATVMPLSIKGGRDAVVVLRLKNHYAHAEDEMIREENLNSARPLQVHYDLFNWRNLYFAPYYCFELANVEHRGLFRSKIDMMVGVEWNKDTPYFSNIVESCTRDLHCYVAQVNTSQFGDTRLTQPKDSAQRDLLKLKGGKNDAVLVGEIELSRLRGFQRKTYGATHREKEFKPLPPDFSNADAIKRINNAHVL